MSERTPWAPGQRVVINRWVADALRFYPTEEGRAALRRALGDAAVVCDAVARDIERSNPGRRKGSVSVRAQEEAKTIRSIGDRLWAMRDKIDVPQSEAEGAPAAVADQGGNGG